MYTPSLNLIGLLLILANFINAQPNFRRSRGASNDVTCGIEHHSGRPQHAPPIIITSDTGAKSCGCASDMEHPKPGYEYLECDAVWPHFGSSEYSSELLLQNACWLDDDDLPMCGTSCTPNTRPNGNGGCDKTEYWKPQPHHVKDEL